MYNFLFQLIDKCYENPNFPNSNIEVIDNLYKSLPFDFINSKHFKLLLKEVNQVIWPDSGTSLYTHVEHVYDQLLQFKISTEVLIYIFYILFCINCLIIIVGTFKK